MNESDTSAASPSSSTRSENGTEPASAAGRPDASQAEVPPFEVSQSAGAGAEEAQADPTSVAPSLPEPVPHAGARYAALRLLLLASVGGILYVVGLRGWPLAFAAVLISGIVSLFLLMKQRNDAAVNLERQVEGWKHRHDHEDAGLAAQ